MSIIISGCGNLKNSKKIDSPKEITNPFSEDKYKTDKDFFRATQMSKNSDIQIARNVALLNAKSEISGLINTKINSITTNYIKENQTQNSDSLGHVFLKISKLLVSQKIVDVKVLDEKVTKDNNGDFLFWIVIEVPKQTILDDLKTNIENNKELQNGFNESSYEKIYKTELEMAD
jgi:hypothetical protein